MFEYNFPFPPYDIQLRFMNELFTVLSESKHGIFESPTGTGKSLSIICATMSWLEKFQTEHLEDLQMRIDQLKSESELSNKNSVHLGKCEQKGEDDEGDDEPDWMKNFEENQALKSELVELKESLRKIEEYLECMEKYKEEDKLSRMEKSEPRSTTSQVDDILDFERELQEFQNGSEESSQEDDLALEDYQSDSETSSKPSTKYDSIENSSEIEEKPDKRHLPQILFCSRTHSQLSQFIKELNKTQFSKNVTAAGIGSRANLCINKSVLNLKHSSAINEACLELINKSNSKKSEADLLGKENEMPAKKRRKSTGPKRCQFYNPGKIDSLRRHILTRTSDIEDIVKQGEEYSACPYYATRFASQSFHVLALPYQALLHKSTREALGISLKNNVVIIDEAHNLLESLASVQSIELSGLDFYTLYCQLNVYMQRYKSKLKSKNLVYIKQLMLVLNQCLRFLGGKANQNPKTMKVTEHANTSVETVNSFTFKAEFDHINLYKLLVYIEKSQICRKLSGFAQRCLEVGSERQGEANPGCLSGKGNTSEKSDNTTAMSQFIKTINQDNSLGDKKQKDDGKNSGSSCSGADNEKNTAPSAVGSKCKIYQLKSFFEVLISDEKLNCKILVKKSGVTVAEASIKSFILNPAHMFSDVVKESRSVILAGGTMQPFEEFTQQLFCALGVNESRVHLFTCGHIVNKSQIRTLIIERGPSNEQLQFSFKDRQNETVFVELGRLLVNVIPRIKGGCVVFFPSYDFESQVVNILTKHKMMDRLTGKKPFFKESRVANNSDAVFEKYKKQIDKNPNSGALLFAVMGGKISEGINFSDNYGRCVIVVGMPYPNSKSLELNAKIEFLNSINRGLGQMHYENLCMKSVNQSIGRAIRHKDDYACVLLVDQRYSRESVRAKLPGWMQESISTCPNFGSVITQVYTFFRSKSD